MTRGPGRLGSTRAMPISVQQILVAVGVVVALVCVQQVAWTWTPPQRHSSWAPLHGIQINTGAFGRTVLGLSYSFKPRGDEELASVEVVRDIDVAVDVDVDVVGRGERATDGVAGSLSDASVHDEPVTESKALHADVPSVLDRLRESGSAEQQSRWGLKPASPKMQALMAKKTLDPEDMPDINSGPWMPGWKNTVAICTVMKEENATDVREWLMYHRWIGVDRVYIYEHFTDEPLAEHPALQDLVQSGFMHYQQANTFGTQGDLNHHCLLSHRHKANWMAFIDADEYMVLRDTGKGKLKTFLEDYKYYGGLSMSWVLMGWNDQELRPRYGGVMRDYTQCNPKPSKIIKTIVNTWYSIGGKGVHNSWYRGYMPSVNEQGIPVPLICKQKNAEAWKKKPKCAMKPARSIENPAHRTVDKIALFHFFSKSKEDYQIKMNKGLAAGTNTRTMEHFNVMSVKDQVKNVPMCQELSQVADECCSKWEG